MHYALYAVIDLLSRKIVGWTVQHRENELIATGLIQPVVTGLGVQVKTVHSDNGSWPHTAQQRQITPGYIETPLASSPKGVFNGLEAKHPLARLGQPEEIANVTTFLLSDKASLMTASYVLVDDGYTAI